MMTKYFAGIDAGTTGATVIVFDEQGDVRSSGYSEYRTKHPYSGWVNQDMTELWNGICDAAKQATSQFPDEVSKISSIGVSSQRGSFVPVDKQWNPLLEAIVWSDGRATREADWIADTIGSERYYSITGLSVSSLWVYAKLIWLKNNCPNILRKCWKIVNGQEWILHKLGSESMFANPSALNYNGMFVLDKLDYSPELFERAGLNLDLMPTIKANLESVGEISKVAAEETGFSVGTPISPGGGDQQCAAVGAGINREGRAELSIGTSAVMVAQLDQAPDMKLNRESGISFGAHAIPGKWDMEATAHAAGGVLRWWRDTYGQPEVRAGKELALSPYDLITLEAADAPVGSDGLLFFPFFNSQANPYFHDNARGGMLGTSQIHTRKHTARATLEGVLYELRMSVEAMEESQGCPFETIRLSGGGARSDFWSQMQADVYGRKVERLQVSECAVLGAAMLGAVASGEINSIDEAVDNMVHTRGFIEPDMHNHAIYSEYFSVFKNAFIALMSHDVYNQLARANEKVRSML